MQHSGQQEIKYRSALTKDSAGAALQGRAMPDAFQIEGASPPRRSCAQRRYLLGALVACALLLAAVAEGRVLEFYSSVTGSVWHRALGSQML